MPEIKAIKHKATVNAFDFNFFADNRGRHEPLQKVAIVTTNSYIKLSMPAYRKLKGPEYFKVGIDINNKVICVAPALATEPYVIKPTAVQIEKKHYLYIKKS